MSPLSQWLCDEQSSRHPHQSQPIPASSNGNVNLIHGVRLQQLGLRTAVLGGPSPGKGRCCQDADPLLGRKEGWRKASGVEELILTIKTSLQNVRTAT